MLNGEYLTKNDVRRKEKELQEKDGEEINNKEKANYEGAEKWEPASKLNFIWVFSYAKFQKKKTLFLSIAVWYYLQFIIHCNDMFKQYSTYLKLITQYLS